MIVYRAVALAAAACLTGLSLAACSGGLTSAGPPATFPASAGSPVSGSGSTISLNAPIGSFPIPPGATVVANDTDGKKVVIVITGVAAHEVSTFYTAALPSAGYTITENQTANGATFSGTAITFSGHGYTGEIGAVSGVGVAGISGLGGDDVAILLTRQ